MWFCVCVVCRVRANTILWRVPVSEDGELSSPQRRFKLHFSRHSHMHVTGETHTQTHTEGHQDHQAVLLTAGNTCGIYNTVNPC